MYHFIAAIVAASCIPISNVVPTHYSYKLLIASSLQHNHQLVFLINLSLWSSHTSIVDFLGQSGGVEELALVIAGEERDTNIAVLAMAARAGVNGGTELGTAVASIKLND